MRIGSLFSGYGGLEMGVAGVLGGDVAWHVENDPAPATVLRHRFPGIPNHGDIRAVDWGSLEPVDVLTGGFPCQDVSTAGRRVGITNASRSGLWSEFARAIDVMRPGLVVIENVRGLLSASADSAMEPDPFSLGDGSGRPTLNAFGVVLGELAVLGYDARWAGVRAADAGAPHARFRVFVIAHPADAVGRESERWGIPRVVAGAPSSRADASPERERFRDAARDRDRAPADARRDRRRGLQEPDVPTGTGLEASRRADADRRAPADADVVGSLRRDPAWRWGAGSPDGDRAPADADLSGLEGWASGGRARERVSRPGGMGSRRDWGSYGPAIARWEAVTGRPAPDPTTPDGVGGAHRLSATFVEWLMGLPAGWVTGPDLGLSRAQQIRILGNGVVPAQAALALSILLESESPRSPRLAEVMAG